MRQLGPEPHQPLLGDDINSAVCGRPLKAVLLSSILRGAMGELLNLDQHEWVIRCSARLHARWPRIGREQRDETAEELWRAGPWRELEPEQAAATWIDLGAPAGERPG